jgi:hypothetical protein
MKKIVLTLILLQCIFIIYKANAQSYTPFPEHVAVWDIYLRPGEPDIRETRYNRYTMKGDTVINSIPYNKVYCCPYYYTYPPNVLHMGKSSYCFGIRQDVANKKVYRTLTVNNVIIDTLLYDYNLKVGDTVPQTYTSSSIGFVQTVKYIDSVTFHGKKYQRFNITGFSGAALIEGVGNANGLIEDHEGAFEAANILYNFCNSDHADCSVPLALKIEETDPVDLLVNVYPNPFTDETTLSFNTEQPKRKAILYNVLGVEIQSYNCSGKQLVIQKEEMKNGIYILKIINGNNAVTKRLIIQ